MKRLPILLLAVTAVAPSTLAKYLPPFKNKLAQVEAAHDQLYHDRLKSQIATQRLVGTNTTATTSISHTTAVSHAPASTSGSFADGSTNSFTLYDSTTLPSPAPPAACSSALVASIACNSTVPLMR
jgi:hypothetical protein